MRKTKLLPAFIMLLAGAITCIMTYLMDYGIRQMLITLLIVLVVFYILGVCVKIILDRFTVVAPASIAEEGEVIEKEVEKEEEQESEDSQAPAEETSTES